MFSRFSGVSADHYGRLTGQIGWVGAQKGSVQRPSLGQATTRPMCLCKMRGEQQAPGVGTAKRARRSM